MRISRELLLILLCVFITIAILPLISDSGNIRLCWKCPTNVSGENRSGVYPSIAAGEGWDAVVWMEYTPYGWIVNYRKLDEGGYMRVDDGFHSLNPDIDISRDGVVVVWQTNVSGNWEIYAREIGGEIGESVKVSEGGVNMDPSVSCYGDRIYITWNMRVETGRYNIALVCLERGKVLWRRVVDEGLAIQPKVAAFDGGTYITWMKRSEDVWDIMYAIYDENGEIEGEPRRISLGHEAQLPMIDNYEERCAVVWQENIDGNWDIYMRILKGSDVGEAVRITHGSEFEIEGDVALWGNWTYVVYAREERGWRIGITVLQGEDRVIDKFEVASICGGFNKHNITRPKVEAYENYVYVVWSDRVGEVLYPMMMRGRWSGGSLQLLEKPLEVKSGEANIARVRVENLGVWREKFVIVCGNRRYFSELEPGESEVIDVEFIFRGVGVKNLRILLESETGEIIDVVESSVKISGGDIFRQIYDFISRIEVITLIAVVVLTFFAFFRMFAKSRGRSGEVSRRGKGD